MRILLITYDNESLVQWFSQSVAYLASTLVKHGHDVVIYEQDIHHYPESHLTAYLDSESFDLVGLSFIGGYYEHRKALKISEAVNRSKRRPYYVIGGFGPSPEPEYFLKKTQADAVVIGEGEETIIDLIDAVEKRKNFKDVAGIAYREAGRTIINPRRELIKDIDSIPIPAYELFNIEHYRLLRMPNCDKTDFILPLLSGRGCTFNCNFCYRMDKGFRPRRSDAIVEEIRLLQEKYRISYIAFSDELLMSSTTRTSELCNAFLDSGLKFKWDCNGRLNYAKPEVLNLMKKAGCVFINYGIEAFDDKILMNMNKALNIRQIEEGIKETLKAGISPGFNIIFGNIGENRQTLMKGVEFLLKYDDGSQMRTIRPVTPYPGSPLYYYAIEKGLLSGIEDFYERRHSNSDLMTCNFTELSDEEYYECLMEANGVLLENFQRRMKDRTRQQLVTLYINRDASFRGFRQN